MWLLKGGRLLCPSTGLDERLDLRVVEGKVAEMGPDLEAHDARVLDCAGAIVGPALIELQSELGDPGQTWREDLRSGSLAGAAGGFGLVVASPNTDPVVDQQSVAADILTRAKAASGAEIRVAGALTMGLLGRELAELNDLLEAGCVALSDGGRAMADSLVLRNALDYARPLGLPVMLRPADAALEERGCMHEGAVSTRIGLHGIPAESEELGLARALALARLAGVRLHLTHVTTARGVALLAAAKAAGQLVTAAVPARHLVLTDEAVDESVYDTNTRVLPPLRPEADRLALVSAVLAGVVDVVSADHVPLTRVEKEHEYLVASPGAAGLETAFLAALTALHDPMAVLRAMATCPGRVLGLDPALRPGARADLVIFEAEGEHLAGPPHWSLGMNEPLAGRRLRGQVRATFVGGRIAYRASPDVIA